MNGCWYLFKQKIGKHMKKQITHISIHQTSKIIAAAHAILTVLFFVLPAALGFLFQGHIISALSMLVLSPFIIWLLFYVGYVVVFWLYNLLIPYTGGIELTLESTQIEHE